MAYVKNIWVDQDVERPKTYEVTNNQDGSITLTDSFGIVTELGTPVNEVNMNHIEEGIDGCAIRKHNLTETFNLGEWVLGGTGDDEGIYKSLVSNNVGNAISDDTKWEKVELGGGGLEIGDIGIAPLGVDETQNKRRYLNGQVIIQNQYTSFTTKLKSAVQLYPSLACTEAQWQATVALSVGGQCGKFVINDTAGTIRLPKIIMPIQGLTNLANLAEIVEAGLPNHQHSPLYVAGSNIDTGDPGQYVLTANLTPNGIQTNTNGYTGNVSNSSVYGNSTTVQQEQIQYPYFIQVATGVEESVDVTREIELNNPFCLFDYKYSEYELDNISWLRSNGQWNSKAVFTDAYDLLLKIYNGTETKAGVSVKLSTQTYDDYDFVLNTSNETFRLPLKVALASGKAVVGNGMTLGLTSGTLNASPLQAGDDYVYSQSYYGQTLPYNSATTVPSAQRLPLGTGLGVSTDATKSGIETSNANLYLYFYVGETVQNANLINAGRIEETLSSIIPDNSNLIVSYGFPDNTYIDLTVGATGTTYTAPANGWFLVKCDVENKNSAFQAGYQTSYGGQGSVGGYGYNSFGGAIVPMLKNQTLTFYYESNTQNRSLRFVYAKGSESEAS